MTRLNAFLSSPALRQAAPDMAVVTIASVEQHGAHLPVATDWLLGQAISERVAAELGAYCLPVMPFGTAREHSGTAGTVYLEPATLMAVVTDLCLALRDQGISRICVLQTHGGNWVIKPTVRDLNLKHGLSVAWLDPFHLAAQAVQAVCPSAAEEVHAGEMETSLLLHLAPDTVDMSKAVDFVPDVTREYLEYATTARICPDGVWGRPSLATAAKGEACLAILVREAAQYFVRTHQRLAALRQ